jgi:predicted nuclease of predicted toxin-antitoxin system
VLADEGVERQIVTKLRAEGHEVYYVAEMEPGISDDRVLEIANEKQALLITADKDFGELVLRRFQANHGVILLRLAGLLNEVKADIVASAILVYGSNYAHAFSVISPRSIRIRQRP